MMEDGHDGNTIVESNIPKTEMAETSDALFTHSERTNVNELKRSFFIGTTEQIKREVDSVAANADIDVIPAFGYKTDAGEIRVAINTDLMPGKHADFATEHEAVELYLRDKPDRASEILDTLKINGWIVGAFPQGPEHYVATYCELKAAKRAGKLEEHLDLFEEMMSKQLSDYPGMAVPILLQQLDRERISAVLGD